MPKVGEVLLGPRSSSVCAHEQPSPACLFKPLVYEALSVQCFSALVLYLVLCGALLSGWRTFLAL